MTKYITPDNVLCDVYSILSVEERDHYTISLVIDCPARGNKHVISRDASITWSPKPKDLIVFYDDGRISIIKPAERGSIGKPAGTDILPTLDTPTATPEFDPLNVDAGLNITSGLSSTDGTSTAANVDAVQSASPSDAETAPEIVMSRSQFGQPKIAPLDS